MKTVALIGRPNTGKSSLFNRLTRQKKAIILDSPGITRDRIFGKVYYKDTAFHLIDTGGIDYSSGNFNESIKMQAKMAINDADVIVFVVDGLTDLTENDREIAKILSKTKKKVIVAVNKLDNEERKDNVYAFYELGFEKVMPISVSHNLGINELLDEITEGFNKIGDEVKHEEIRFALLGRPNVGKSSLTNAILGEKRAIVSNVPGTTRDAVDTRFTYDGKPYVIVDTAGLRKKGRIFESVEKYSLIRTLNAIDDADVCVLVLNAEEGIIEHDKHIASYILDAGKALVIAINKWDVVENKAEGKKVWEEAIKENFKFVSYAKVLYLSALTKKKIDTLMPAIIEAFENASRTIQTSALNEVINEAYTLHPAPSYKGRRLKIYFVHQEGTNPPKFVFNVNDKGLVHFSYERYLENTLRKNFLLDGTPIIIKFKNKNE